MVSTPIGNLEDMTLRALRVLSQVDLIAAEDTRHTGVMLQQYEVNNQLTSYHDHNKEKKAPRLISFLKSGKNVAMVSDAGTPGISDPAFYLVRAAVKEGIEVVPVPGPSAFLAALVVSGLPTDRFVFEGYLPQKQSKRLKKLESLKEEERTIIFYESRHRLKQVIEDILETFGDRQTVLARELTKKFEEVRRGKTSEILTHVSSKGLRGEVVILVAGKPKR
ncbi:MAG: 16S rRNA methyltransferase [candidate division Zixibacteria bacterium DG_27]|nr:MAG: 16S rRNA methyltransferase [candidate division Zixibacteria bacterium DG_27]